MPARLTTATIAAKAIRAFLVIAVVYRHPEHHPRRADRDAWLLGAGRGLRARRRDDARARRACRATRLPGPVRGAGHCFEHGLHRRPDLLLDRAPARRRG